MKTTPLLLSALLLATMAQAQKKPLDHSVYDGWQAIGERSISNNGKYVAYTINPQEGDGTLVIQATDNSFKKEFARGANAVITPDNRFVIFRLKPFFKDLREARIKKKKPDEMPKDTLVIFEFGKDSIFRVPRVKGFKTPEKGTGQWVAYLMEKALPGPPKVPAKPDSLTQLSNLEKMADSLIRVSDSLRKKAVEARTKGLSILQPAKKEGKPGPKNDDPVEEGTELVLKNLYTGEERKYTLVSDYDFSEKGNVLLVETTRKNNDSLTQSLILWTSLPSGKTDTVMRKFNDARNFSFDKEGTQLAFTAERDSVAKALVKFHRLWYYKAGDDSAHMRADRNTPGIAKGLTVSDSYTPQFSKDGQKLYFGLLPIRKPKDTSLVDFETARLDIWNYKDDYLQPQQLLNLQSDLRRSYLAVFNNPDAKNAVQLGADDAENVFTANEGNADFVLAFSSKGNRVASQWQGFSYNNAFLISTADASRKLVKEKKRGGFSTSPSARFVAWYDPEKKNYFAYEVATGQTRDLTSKITTTRFWDDEDDHPDDPGNFGFAKWLENDEAVLIYDRYDIWQIDPTGKAAPVNITNGFGKKNKIELRILTTDREARFVKLNEQLLFEAFDHTSKYGGYFTKKLDVHGDPVKLYMGPYGMVFSAKAKDAEIYMLGMMDIREPMNLNVSSDLQNFTKLSDINPQQKDYNWLTVELMKWKMFDGKESEGLLFKPENFDPKKKYPVIFYFYERNADNLYNYRAPAPSASVVNIPYFVSNGYLVFDPNIWYKNGQPGESAYNSVVSAAKMLARLPFVDSTKMAIQGQSWGGYQVAYLVTRTNMFAAAGAGAPVANMTSAYGGIRWGSGLNRQFQYERTQSRIGATLWQRQDLYIKNSPLFTANKVNTPLLIMHNDMDGAVPWYQGIEYFTALRRLGKKVWMLQYNGEDHNLVERRNRKDLSIRLGQFFDHYLKGAPAPKWMTEGVPATEKGIDWGTGTETSNSTKAGF
ncbi:alpha/beta hydrolase family protein [Pseudobacter ginsenosidimutans]|uniref:Dipeptidyl aminopeptidase/acylaminoacyl peptidase n=1 Tax=Pseudobacter ginsenosidimutans TaxID=661488 RepID=A0A4Q7MFI5_9BACT|nr:prolyl oligopeptidase family serine peptidase [Pseudobacter ginsenosidimutans]QEC45408.1 S9 family peptidase [Pseudobacter ginsenosidimutans]RZS66936.1 dipeptidyl aminopeptidase/acylaminoacyl peptidase [Pseudobacter ginsenosidimutans]